MFTQLDVMGHTIITLFSAKHRVLCAITGIPRQTTKLIQLVAQQSQLSMDKPAWAKDLEPRGTYYEGFVEDLDSLLTRFKAETVTTYGTRRSRYIIDGSSDQIREPAGDQENTQVR